jgi:hypothetical protein
VVLFPVMREVSVFVLRRQDYGYGVCALVSVAVVASKIYLWI